MPDQETSISVIKNPPELPGVTLGTLFQFQMEGLGTSTTLLIGMDSGLCLIIRTPPIPEIATKLYEKNHIIIRYFHAGKVYGFRSTLLAIIKEPVRLCILSYPESIEIMNLRKHERLNCLIPTVIKIRESSAAISAYEGMVSDVSVGGCSFEFNAVKGEAFPRLAVGDEVVVDMQLPGQITDTELKAAVRRIRLDTKAMILGMQFLSSGFQQTDSAALDNIRAYLETTAK